MLLHDLGAGQNSWSDMCSLLPGREDENSFLVTSEHGFGPGDIDVTTKVKEVVVSGQVCLQQA